MKYRMISSMFSAAALVLVVGVLAVPKTTKAGPVFQDPPTRTMYVVGHGPVQVLRLYDQPDPLGKTQKVVPVGMPVEVYTDQLYNKYWYKTTEEFYAHQYYLTEIDPSLAAAEEAVEEISPEDRQREDELLAKYMDIEIVSMILRKEIRVGFTQDQVRDSWGEPDSWHLSKTTAMGDEVMWEYDALPGKRGAARLSFDYRKKLVNYVVEK